LSDSDSGQSHARLKVRESGATERKRFVTGWQTVQSRFVDHPKAAVTEADDLIAALLEACGYPKDSFEQRAADFSVTYPRVMKNYRVRRLRPSPGEEYRSSGRIFPPGSSRGAERKPSTRQPSFPEHFLPAILLSVVFAGTAISGGAHQATSSANSAPAAQLSPIDPDSQITPEDIGDSMLVHKRCQAAIESYLNASNDSPGVWNKRGIAYQMLFDLKDAEHCYRRPLLIRPDHPWVLNNLGTIYDAQGDFRKSEAIYRKALALEPTSARIAANLGTSLMIQNKYHEGAKMYKRALALDPTYSTPTTVRLPSMACPSNSMPPSSRERSFQ
jgi:tetratricopeptide (TPR) repeat protein